MWTLDLGHQLSVTPAYAGSHAYFALDDNQIAAYDLSAGTREWVASGRPLLPLATGSNLVYVVEIDQLRALAATDGHVAWQLPLTTGLSAAPVWDNGWLVLTTQEGDIIALRATDGQVIWRRTLASRPGISAGLAADRVYVAAEDGQITALRVDTGATVWTSSVGGKPTGLLALDDRLFVGSTDNFFYSVSAANGKWDWRWRTGADVVGVPVVDEQNVYFVSLDNVLRALGRRNGVQQWVRPLPLRPLRGPITAGASLIVTGVAPTLRAYKVSDGTPAGELTTDGELAAPAYDIPGIALPTLLVLTRNLANGATATLYRRQIEPAPTALVPLKNLVVLPPAQETAIRP